MIKLIETLRIEQRISKAELSRNAWVSTQMYYKYLNGSSLPVEVFKKMLDYLGYDLRAIKKDSSIKL